MRIAVVGTGYVGLTTGACLAETGNAVVCADIVAEKVEALGRGEIPFHEPGLAELVRRNLAEGRLSFTTDVARAVRASYVIFIAVGTPPDEDGSADLRAVVAAAADIGRAMDGERIVITKSTVPVGTARLVREAIEAETEHRALVCSNPEFLKEGAALSDFRKPDRVVIGVDDPVAGEVLRGLYAPFVRTGKEILVMDTAAAEITKYAANAMLATRISLMNTIARLCERTGADVDMVRLGVGSDRRIGPTFLFPGAGYGGSCFPKDVKALAGTMRRRGVDSSILEAVENVNEDQKRWLLRRVVERFGETLRERTFAVWGLAFKPETDDMREAPSLVTIRGLLERGARVVAHDPVAMGEARRILGDEVEYRERNYDALEGADALIIHTEWHPYRHPDFARMRDLMRTPVVLDGRNLYAPAAMRDLGFEYRSVGRCPARPRGAERRAAAGRRRGAAARPARPRGAE